MGYVPHPIPPDVLAKMPPEIRKLAIQQERDFLAQVQERQARTAVYGIASLICLAAIAAGVFFR